MRRENKNSSTKQQNKTNITWWNVGLTKEIPAVSFNSGMPKAFIWRWTSIITTRIFNITRCGCASMLVHIKITLIFFLHLFSSFFLCFSFIFCILIYLNGSRESAAWSTMLNHLAIVFFFLAVHIFYLALFLFSRLIIDRCWIGYFYDLFWFESRPRSIAIYTASWQHFNWLTSITSILIIIV